MNHQHGPMQPVARPPAYRTRTARRLKQDQPRSPSANKALTSRPQTRRGTCKEPNSDCAQGVRRRSLYRLQADGQVNNAAGDIPASQHNALSQTVRTTRGNEQATLPETSSPPAGRHNLRAWISAMALALSFQLGHSPCAGSSRLTPCRAVTTGPAWHNLL